MSFRLSAGTLDSMAGVFAPAKKYRLGSGGGQGGQAKPKGAILGLAVASMLTRPASGSGVYRPGQQTKQAFGGSTHSAVSRRAVSTLERTARRVPEVMVRITGRQHGAGHVLANFSYISRLGHGADKTLALHTSDGDVLRDGRDMQVLAQDWQEWEMGDDARRKGATSLSMILSMPSGTDPEALQRAALDFAREEFANRSWVASLHVDRDHPHVHLTVARRDHDGRRFHPDRDDLFRYRQRFAQKLRDRGIEANATPAKARGLDAKHEHIAARKVREKGGVPRIDRTREQRTARFGGEMVTDPVSDILAQQHASVRSAYEQSIAELGASPSLVDQAVARSLTRFVETMTAPEPNCRAATRQRAIERQIDSVDARVGKGAEPDPVAAALARSQAMRDRINIDRQTRGDQEAVRGDDTRVRATGVSDRLQALVEAAEKQSSTAPPSKTDDVLRQAQDRERDRDTRDRAKDKDGPRR